jgi:Tfp pilus assembly protein PilF
MPPQPPVKATGPAASLIETGRKQLAAGHPDQAETTLERAVRIDPRNPQVWHSMGRVQYVQGNFAKAVQFCLKANALLHPASSLRRANWQLLADAYQQLGQAAKAQEAREQAARSDN